MDKTQQLLFRPCRGGLDTEMKEVMEIKSRECILKYLSKCDILPDKSRFAMDKLHIKYYGYDERIDWETYIVMLDNYGVVGYTNWEI